MAIKKSNGIAAIYCGAGYDPKLSTDKYPPIVSGDKGIVIPAHNFEVEKHPERPFNFYPAKWGYIYFFSVSPDDFAILENYPTMRLPDHATN